MDTTDTTYRIRLVYRRSMRRAVMATGIPSRDVADIFVKALIADDAEQMRDATAIVPWTYEIEEERLY